ncbi:MAG TPA: hypothetical protein VLH15_08700 [Dehalococcoidales bacterium]|nr:hypothetical protein [Dehalococcoidales bacterium]
MGKDNSLLTVLDPRGQPSGIFGRSTAPNMHPGAILDPSAQPSGGVEPVRMAQRPDSLENKTLFLVNTGFAGAPEFMQELKDWFNNHMPAVKTELRNKQGGIFTDDPALWAEIKEKGNAAILGVGG